LDGLAMALRDEQISDFPLCNKSFNLHTAVSTFEETDLKPCLLEDSETQNYRLPQGPPQLPNYFAATETESGCLAQ
jgi:hypothetical protein